jgi:hypothetical protein
VRGRVLESDLLARGPHVTKRGKKKKKNIIITWRGKPDDTRDHFGTRLKLRLISALGQLAEHGPKHLLQAVDIWSISRMRERSRRFFFRWEVTAGALFFCYPHLPPKPTFETPRCRFRNLAKMLIALGGLSGGAKVNCVIFSNYLRLSHQKMAIFEVSILYRVPYVYIPRIRQHRSLMSILHAQMVIF